MRHVRPAGPAYAAPVTHSQTVADPHQEQSPPPVGRLFVPADAGFAAALAGADLPRDLEVVLGQDVVAEVVAAGPTPHDVVVLDAASLPAHPLGIASHLVEVHPARVLVASHDAREDRVLTALRLGAVDVLARPVRAEDLALRVRLVQRRWPARLATDGDLFHLLHEITNILGAMRLTSYLVGHPDLGADAGDGGSARWTVAELAARLDREVEGVVGLVGEVERRLRLLHHED